MSEPKGLPHAIILWGADNYNTLGLLRQLSNADFRVFFANTGRKNSCASVSKYCTDYIHIPISQEGLTILITKFSTFPTNPILITTGDESAEFVDQHRELLLPHFLLSGTTVSGVLTKIDNKNEMAQLARHHGFNILASTPYDINATVPVNFPFPAILKPVIMANGVSEFKYRYFENIDSLQHFTQFLNPANTYILQQYIAKTYDVLVYGVRLHNGDVILAGRYIKDRWSDDGGGSHGQIVGDVPMEYNPEGIKSFLREIDYHGLFSVEYGLLDGKPWFYEFNLRNDGTSHLFYQSGANLPLKWCLDSWGINKDISTVVQGSHWNINEIYDITNVLKGRISFGEYKQQKKQADVFHYFDPKDLKPYKIARRKALYDVPFRMLLKPLRPYLTWIIWKLKR